MDAAHVAWIFELKVKEGRADALRALMTEMVDATQAGEPGTLDYEWYLSEDGSRVHVYERYQDSAAVLAHLATFSERYMPHFFGTLVPERLVIYGSPNEAVRGALATLAPVVMTHAAGFSRHQASTT